jgi:anti-sigma B factor antagonist
MTSPGALAQGGPGVRELDAKIATPAGRARSAPSRRPPTRLTAFARGGEALRFDVKRVGTVSVVRVNGEADIFTSPALDGAIAGASRAHRGTIVVSFVDCTFADCSSLNVLIRQYKRLAARLQIVAPPATALGRILGLTKLTGVLPVHGSLRAAYLAILSDPHASLGNLANWRSQSSTECR